MAHPMREQASDALNAKMKRMTDGYGAASGPKNNIAAPATATKPADATVGFGEGNAGKARMDRGRRVSNPVATYARGGAVKRAEGGVIARKAGGAIKRAVGGDVSSIEEANRDQAADKRAAGGAVAQRAKGGRTKGKGGHTHVNVIVAPQGGGGPGAGAMPPVLPIGPGAGGPPMPPPMPPRPPMAAGPMPGGPPMMPPPGAIPPGAMPPRKHGGAVHKDEAQDKALIKKTLKAEGLTEAKRAHGGRLPNQKHHMTAGAVSGEGRLEKIGKEPKDAGRPQAV